MKLPTAAVILLAASACARAHVPDLEPGERRAFRASSVHSEFFIVGEFEGVAEVWSDSIRVQVSRGRIDTRGKPDDDIVLRVALANGDTAARWRVREASNAAPLPGIRRDAAGNLRDTLRFSLRRPPRPLSDQWLVFVFERDAHERGPDGRPVLHTAFAHSQPDVFAPRRVVGEALP